MKIVSFIGMDGTGKTTHAKWLLQMLREYGKPATYIHTFSPKATVLDSLLPAFSLRKRIEKSVRTPSSNSLAIAVKLLLRLLAIIADSWLTFCVNKLRYRKVIVIYDRYFYDALVIAALSSNKLSIFVLKLSRLVTKPDITFLLMARPKIATERKYEHTPANAKKIYMLYKKLEQSLPIIPINTEVSVGEVRQRLLKLCEVALI